jgi:hypothetical protein
MVICYSYLWSDEAEQAAVEGAKDRPCAIVVTLGSSGENRSHHVAVVPVTHAPPRDPDAAIEIPARVKAHLGLDDRRSWIILDEMNVFTWPGFDLRPIRRGADRVDYGLLPPAFFWRLIEKLRPIAEAGGVARIVR